MSDPLSDIRQYSPRLTIAQLGKFFEKKGIALTRPMVQNYIKAGLLPPPAGKRFYTHKHIAALVMICRLKQVFDIATIKRAMEPLMDGEGLPLETYGELVAKLPGIAARAGLGGEEIAVQMLFASEIADGIRRAAGP